MFKSEFGVPNCIIYLDFIYNEVNRYSKKLKISKILKFLISIDLLQYYSIVI